jgi:hypothetical protein
MGRPRKCTLAIAFRRDPWLWASLGLPRILKSPVFNNDIGGASVNENDISSAVWSGRIIERSHQVKPSSLL